MRVSDEFYIKIGENYFNGIHGSNVLILPSNFNAYSPIFREEGNVLVQKIKKLGFKQVELVLE